MKKAAAIALVLASLAGVAVFGDEYLAGGAEQRNEFGNVEYDGRLVFVRLRYDMGFPGAGRARGSYGEPPWMHDYPTADIHMMKIVQELSLVEPRTDASNVLTLDDPALFDFPIAYMSEPGYWTMSDEEAKGLGAYLRKGGLIIFDDFRDEHWFQMEAQMKRALPEGRWIQLNADAKVFHMFFEIDGLDLLTSYGPHKPEYWGIFENNDQSKRLMAIANFNNDLGEYWEFSDQGIDPVDLSNEAYKFGVNYFIYGLIH
jgi:Domain of unknown function (DUF4159)